MKNLFYLSTSFLLLLSACGGGNNTQTIPTTPSNPIPDPVETQISRFDIRFNTSTFDGCNDTETSCTESGNILSVYVSGHYTNLNDAFIDRKKLYKDSLLTQTMSSDNKWFKSDDKVFLLSTDGHIAQFSSCN